MWEVKAKHMKREGVVQLNKSMHLSQKVQGSDSSQACELHRPHSLLLSKHEGLRIMRIQVEYDGCKPGTQADKGREGIPAVPQNGLWGTLLNPLSAVCVSFILFVFLLLFWISFPLSPICWKGLIQFHFSPASYILKSLLWMKLCPWGGTGFLDEKKKSFFPVLLRIYWHLSLSKF